jgi:uncharacterized protein (TIGR02145 family)
MWEQLFTWEAAKRETEKQWKRLPLADDDNKEFQAIIDKVWVEEFMKLFPGCRYTLGSDFWDRGSDLYLWSACSNAEGNACNMHFFKGVSSSDRYWCLKSHGLSVRCLKD